MFDVQILTVHDRVCGIKKQLQDVAILPLKMMYFPITSILSVHIASTQTDIQPLFHAQPQWATNTGPFLNKLGAKVHTVEIGK